MLKVRPLSREEVRGIDVTAAQQCGLPTLVMMENAGRGAAEWFRAHCKHSGKVLLLCGPGNNGGDGGVVARHLDAWGFPVRTIWFAGPEHIRGDAQVQHRIVEKSGIAQSHWTESTDPQQLDALLADADWIFDGLLGTGLTRPVEGLLRAVIAATNRSGKPVIALDLPSGLDADTGQPQGIAVQATATITFVAPKLGFAQPGAQNYTGEVAVVEIGVPRRVLEPFLVA